MIDLPDGHEQPATTELETTAVGPLAPELWALAERARSSLPPPMDDEADSEPPPTVRWTPPPLLIARSRFDSRGDDMSSRRTR